MFLRLMGSVSNFVRVSPLWKRNPFPLEICDFLPGPLWFLVTSPTARSICNSTSFRLQPRGVIFPSAQALHYRLFPLPRARGKWPSWERGRGSLSVVIQYFPREGGRTRRRKRKSFPAAKKNSKAFTGRGLVGGKDASLPISGDPSLSSSISSAPEIC